MSEVNENTTNAFQHFKNIFKMLFKKQFKDSLKELWLFIKDVCIWLKKLYDKYLKGQYITVKGKRIPRTVVAILAVFVLYLISPMSCIFSSDPLPEPAPATETQITYDKDGLKVYDMRKCDQAVCGIMEYRGEQDIERLNIIVTFYDPTGHIVAKNGKEWLQLTPNSGNEFTIPSKDEFGYFKSKVLINATDEELEEQTVEIEQKPEETEE